MELWARDPLLLTSATRGAQVKGGGTVDLKMRVFVVNSEDAKAVAEYIKAHMDQVPAPFVVLARHLSMAVLYDPLTLDLSDASVADRLRKQVLPCFISPDACAQARIRRMLLSKHCGLLSHAAMMNKRS